MTFRYLLCHYLEDRKTCKKIYLYFFPLVHSLMFCHAFPTQLNVYRAVCVVVKCQVSVSVARLEPELQWIDIQGYS